MAIFAVQNVKLTDKITVQVGTEITLRSIKCGRHTRGVIVAAYIGESWKAGDRGCMRPYIEVEYVGYKEVRRLDDNGQPE